MNGELKRFVLTLGMVCGAAALAAEPAKPAEAAPAPTVDAKSVLGGLKNAVAQTAKDAATAVKQQAGDAAAAAVKQATGAAQETKAAAAQVKAQVEAPAVPPMPPVPENPRLKQARARMEYMQLMQRIGEKEAKLKEDNAPLRKALEEVAAQIQLLQAEARKKLLDADPELKAMYEKRDAIETELRGYLKPNGPQPQHPAMGPVPASRVPIVPPNAPPAAAPVPGAVPALAPVPPVPPAPVAPPPPPPAPVTPAAPKAPAGK